MARLRATGLFFFAGRAFVFDPNELPAKWVGRRLGPAYIVSVTQEDTDVAIEDWAKDPERARAQLRRVLRELAARIADSYPWR